MVKCSVTSHDLPPWVCMNPSHAANSISRVPSRAAKTPHFIAPRFVDLKHNIVEALRSGVVKALLFSLLPFLVETSLGAVMP